MSLTHLSTHASGAVRKSRDTAARDHVIALVRQIDGDARLTLAADMLSGIISLQSSDTRGLTQSELEALSLIGINENALLAPVVPVATMKATLWERQAELDTYTVTEAAALLGVTTARIRQRCAAGTLLAQRRSDGWHLPIFQFPDQRELPGWAVVSAAIPSTTPLLLSERVLTSATSRLTVEGEALAPFEWLAQGGDPERAAHAVNDALTRLP